MPYFPTYRSLPAALWNTRSWEHPAPLYSASRPVPGVSLTLGTTPGAPQSGDPTRDSRLTAARGRWAGRRAGLRLAGRCCRPTAGSGAAAAGGAGPFRAVSGRGGGFHGNSGGGRARPTFCGPRCVLRWGRRVRGCVVHKKYVLWLSCRGCWAKKGPLRWPGQPWYRSAWMRIVEVS